MLLCHTFFGSVWTPDSKVWRQMVNSTTCVGRNHPHSHSQRRCFWINHHGRNFSSWVVKNCSRFYGSKLMETHLEKLLRQKTQKACSEICCCSWRHQSCFSSLLNWQDTCSRIPSLFCVFCWWLTKIKDEKVRICMILGGLSNQKLKAWLMERWMESKQDII